MKRGRQKGCHSSVVAVASMFKRSCGWRSVGVVGVEFGHGSFSVKAHNGTMNPQRNVPLTAIIIRRGLLNPFE